MLLILIDLILILYRLIIILIFVITFIKIKSIEKDILSKRLVIILAIRILIILLYLPKYQNYL